MTTKDFLSFFFLFREGYFWLASYYDAMVSDILHGIFSNSISKYEKNGFLDQNIQH